MGCFATKVVSLEVPRCQLSELRYVNVMGSDKAGHRKCSDGPTVMLKILTTLIRAYDGHAESLKLVVILNLIQCRYIKTARRIFKYSDKQYTSLTLDKN